jgi:membrane protein
MVVSSLASDLEKLKAKKAKAVPHSLGEPGERPAESLATPRAWWSLLRDAASGWMAHKVSSMGAALAYYSLFSIGPLILIVITVAGLVFGEEAVRGAVSQQLSHLLGDQGAKGVENMLAVAGKPAEGVFGTILGAGTLVFAAIGVVVHLKDSLNTVWEVKPRESSGVWSFIRIYGISFAGVLSLGFLLLISLLITTALSAMGTLLTGFVPELALQAISFTISFSMTTALFAMMFKWLPDIEIGWKEVLPGGLLTAALFEIGKLLIGFYIGKQGLESSFGAAASLVIVLIWVYYSAQLVLFGAEITRAYAARSRGKPKGERAGIYPPAE